MLEVYNAIMLKEGVRDEESEPDFNTVCIRIGPDVQEVKVIYGTHKSNKIICFITYINHLLKGAYFESLKESI